MLFMLCYATGMLCHAILHRQKFLIVNRLLSFLLSVWHGRTEKRKKKDNHGEVFFTRYIPMGILNDFAK